MTEQEFRGHLIEMGASMKAFARRCFQMTLKVESPPFHDDLYRHYTDKSITKILTVAPRKHAKTSISSEILPLHTVLFSALTGQDPEFVVLVSKTRDLTFALLQTIKDHLDSNEALRFYFGDWGQKTARKWAAHEIVLKNGSVIAARGMGSQLHGMKRGQQRPTLVILDDPEDDKNAGNREAMDANYTWFEKALIPVTDPRRHRIVVIGTMINEGCLVDRLSKIPSYKVLWYKAIPDREIDGVMTEWDGKSRWPVLWPEWMPFESLMSELEDQRVNGFEHIWWMNYQNVFRTGENQPFKKEFFRRYKGKLVKTGATTHAIALEWARDASGDTIYQDCVVPINIGWGYDPASSESGKADETVIEFWGMDAKKNCFHLWKFHKRVDPLVAADEFYPKAIELCPVTGNIETIQAQETIRSYLRHKTNEEGTWIPGLDKKNQPRAKKSVRLLSEFWRIRNGMTYIRDEEDDDLLSQFILYVVDKDAQHDDMLDAWYYAVKDLWPCDQDHKLTLEVVEPERKVATLGLDSVDGELTWMGQ